MVALKGYRTVGGIRASIYTAMPVAGAKALADFMASFVGMVPASNPKLVVAVVVDDPKNQVYGGSVAAPAFQKIVGWAVPYLGINPCVSPCPMSALQPAMPSHP